MIQVIFFSAGLILIADRIYFFAFLNEAAGWRQVTEVGLLASRGTAAAISFVYPFMLLSMSKNIMTILRQKWINQYIPFDKSFDFHRIAAYAVSILPPTHVFTHFKGVVLATIHTIGHMINFRMLSMQSSSVLTCLLPNLVSHDGTERHPTFAGFLFTSHQGMIRK